MKLSEDLLKSLLTNPSVDYKHRNINALCPYCGYSEWGISLDNNHLFNCFRKSKCGETGNIYKLLRKLNRLDLLSNRKESIQYNSKLEDIITKKIDNNILENLDIRTITPPIGFKRIYSNFYLENRGFELFDKFDVGISKIDYKLKDRVIFLIREDNEIKGYLSRITKTREELKILEDKIGHKIPRYINSETDFTKLLGGLDEIDQNTEEVILVEGLLGKEGVDRNLKIGKYSKVRCCCTFGAKLSKEQIFKLQLRGIKKITLFFDIDVINKIKKHALELIQEFEDVKIIYSIDINKDPADLNEIEMIKVYNNKVDPIEFYFNKVQVLRLK